MLDSSSTRIINRLMTPSIIFIVSAHMNFGASVISMYVLITTPCEDKATSMHAYHVCEREDEKGKSTALFFSRSEGETRTSHHFMHFSGGIITLYVHSEHCSLIGKGSRSSVCAHE